MMTNKAPDKSIIRQRFARSMATYNDNAVIQQDIANRLLEELIAAAGDHFGRVLEIGCGSGLLTELLTGKFDYRHLYLNDLVEQCRFLCDKIADCSFIAGDIESLDCLPGELDLIISNAVFQWLHDLPATISNLTKKLAAGGLLAFSTFGKDNLSEIRSILGLSLDYYSLPEILDMLAKDFQILYCHEKSYFLEFPAPLDVLRHMKKTGVTAVSVMSWTKSGLKDFAEQYRRRFSSTDGVVLTYQPIVVIASLK